MRDERRKEEFYIMHSSYIPKKKSDFVPDINKDNKGKWWSNEGWSESEGKALRPYLMIFWNI